MDGRRFIADGASPSFYYAVTPDYFNVLNLRITEGRAFSGAETNVAIVSEEMVRRIWAGASPIGERIRFPERSGAGD